MINVGDVVPNPNVTAPAPTVKSKQFIIPVRYTVYVPG